jgi:hypothetical protein
MPPQPFTRPLARPPTHLLHFPPARPAQADSDEEEGASRQLSSVTSSGRGGPPPSSNTIAALAAGADNTAWVVYRRGRVERYTEAGRLLASGELGGRAMAAAGVGPRLWVGFAGGALAVLDGGQWRHGSASRAAAQYRG